jgi:signal peptidase II
MNADSSVPNSSRNTAAAYLMSPANIIMLVFIADQISKLAILRLLGHNVQTIIPGFFRIVLVQNKGAAWGIFSNYPELLTAIAFIALIVIIASFKKICAGKRVNEIALSLLAGGITGNLFDRIIRGSVVDFLDFYVGDNRWPAFNIADSAITISVMLFLLNSFLDDRKNAKSA